MFLTQDIDDLLDVLQRRKIDHAKVLELRAAGKMGREIAAELGISEPSVWRILKRR